MIYFSNSIKENNIIKYKWNTSVIGVVMKQNIKRIL